MALLLKRRISSLSKIPRNNSIVYVYLFIYLCYFHICYPYVKNFFYRLESEWRCVTILVGTSKKIKHFSFSRTETIVRLD